MDGKNIQDEFFDGRIAAEMRLWEALENDLLSPFHYFGISDNTDLSAVKWLSGALRRKRAEQGLTGNHARARLIVKAVEEKVDRSGRHAGAGLLRSSEHAHFMAMYFRAAGLTAIALVRREPPAEQRKQALADLKSGARTGDFLRRPLQRGT